MLVYTTHAAVARMAKLFQDGKDKNDEELAEEFGKLISESTAVPDMALSGRMLETGVLKNTTVEAALQVAHAISTHEARPEVDYYVAADDIPGEDAGAGFVDEAMFASACFYKYFSIDWETLVKNLKGNKELAAHTVGAFIRAAALVNPTGKQNSFAAHNPPDGMLVEMQEPAHQLCQRFCQAGKRPRRPRCNFAEHCATRPIRPRPRYGLRQDPRSGSGSRPIFAMLLTRSGGRQCRRDSPRTISSRWTN